MSVVVVGLNHRSARLELLESTAVPADAVGKALFDLHQRQHIDEVVVLSTCMRTEIYVETSRYHGAVGDVRSFLCDWSGHPPETFDGSLYEYFDERAVEHLLRVASGLESVVLGEGEILRQVRSAWDAAVEAQTLGPVLAAAGRRALGTGKRVRSETGIARGTTSLSHTAVMLAGEILGRSPLPDDLATDAIPCAGAQALRGRRVLVLGAGEMGRTVASLLATGPGLDVRVANRHPERAAELATGIGATTLPWAEVPAALAEVDLVVSATSAPGHVVDEPSVRAASTKRGGRALVLVDLALPRDVDPAVAGLPGVTLLGLGELEAAAATAMEGRRAQVPAAEAIVAEELVRWASAAAERDVVPVVVRLRERAEAVRRAELARLAPRLANLEPAERRAVEALTKGIVAKLLHQPTVGLKAAAAEERGARLAAALVELWDLDRD